MYKKQTDIIRTQIERSQLLAHSTPIIFDLKLRF